MIVESVANDDLKENLNAVGRVYYSFSTLLCTPCSRSQEVGLCLGAQSGERRMRDVVTSAGFQGFPELPKRLSTLCMKRDPKRPNKRLRFTGRAFRLIDVIHKRVANTGDRTDDPHT